MLLFEAIFKNHFNTKEISDDSFKKFVEDHIQRAIAKNSGGTYTVMITDTTNAYTTYFGNLTSEDFAFAVQQGLTITADTIIRDFQKTVSLKEGTIRGLYGNTGIYQEFFPFGLTEYSNATKANIETLMTRMVNASTAHVADLGAPFVAIWTTFKTNYVNSRTAQLLKIGEVDNTKTMTSTTRDALEVQLLKNLFFVGFNNPGNVTACMDFFKQDIIRYDEDSATDGFGKIKGVIRDSVTQQILIDAEAQVLGSPTIPVAKNKADGYKTQRIEIGNRQVRFSFPGKTPRIMDVTIVDAGETTLNVDL